MWPGVYVLLNFILIFALGSGYKELVLKYSELYGLESPPKVPDDDPFNLVSGLIHRKVTDGPILYVLSYYWLPTITKYLGRRGPSSRTGEFAIGALAWLLFCLYVTTPSLSDPEELMQWALRLWPVSSNTPWMVYGGMEIEKMPGKYLLIFPCGLVLVCPVFLLIIAAFTYLPVTAIPQLAYNGFLGALVLIPLSKSTHLSDVVPFALSLVPGSSMYQAALLGVYFVLFACLAALMQTAGMSLVLAIYRLVIVVAESIRPPVQRQPAK